MDIEEIGLKKDKLQETINELFQDFEIETGVFIDDISPNKSHLVFNKGKQCHVFKIKLHISI